MTPVAMIRRAKTSYAGSGSRRDASLGADSAGELAADADCDADDDSEGEPGGDEGAPSFDVGEVSSLGDVGDDSSLGDLA